MQNRAAFADFVAGLLRLNPIERWSPQQARMHPFITGEPYLGPYEPPPTDLSGAMLNNSNTDGGGGGAGGATHAFSNPPAVDIQSLIDEGNNLSIAENDPHHGDRPSEQRRTDHDPQAG